MSLQRFSLASPAVEVPPPANPKAILPASGRNSEANGDIVEIGSRRFKLQEIIGRGAFGVVWSARETKGVEVTSDVIAIKVVQAKDGANFVAAQFEAELMEMLCATGSQHGGPPSHSMPRYIAHSASKSAGSPAGAGTVRLAMTYVKGGPLDKWLYGISDEEHKTAPIQDLVQGPLPGSQQGSRNLKQACSIARGLLTQLSTVFVALQPIAFHRDVSSHNVLLDVPQEDGPPQFALIDFGLAVRSGSWEKDWRTSNLAGDPRYWTPGAWMAFSYGFKYLTTHPNDGFERQYKQRIDHFGVGVLVLEALLALWDSSEARPETTPHFMEVRAAWMKYWSVAIHMFQMFHIKGPQQVRNFITHSQDEGVSSLVKHLQRLTAALHTAANQAANAHCAALLLVLADLVSENGSANWAQIPGVLAEDLAPVPTGGSAARAICQQARTRPMTGGLSHSRIRSTGGAEQELTRQEFVVGPQRVIHPATALSSDVLSKSFSHKRRSSGYF